MAFASTRPRTLGLGGGLKMTVGEWSTAAGDASGELTVEAALVYLADFRPARSSGPLPVEIACSESVSSRIATITVNHGPEAVTAGRYTLIYA